MFYIETRMTRLCATVVIYSMELQRYAKYLLTFSYSMIFFFKRKTVYSEIYFLESNITLEFLANWYFLSSSASAFHLTLCSFLRVVSHSVTTWPHYSAFLLLCFSIKLSLEDSMRRKKESKTIKKHCSISSLPARFTRVPSSRK